MLGVYTQVYNILSVCNWSL